MDIIDQTAFNQIATTLAGHFDSMYYVDIETGNFTEFIHSDMLNGLNVPEHGEDFFATASRNAHKVVHPYDLETVLKIHNRETILENLAKGGSYSVSCRLVINREVIHIRHVDIMCADQKHILFCMENVEQEYREREEQKKNLRSAQRLARRDELTGIKNSNAFKEYIQSIDDNIRSGKTGNGFGVVICDINDLKLMNDTRGHSFGDEAIQRASRMICEAFKHSPVFRIGGDEFAVILTDSDYEQREELLCKLKEESIANGRSNSGPVVAAGLAVYDGASDNSFTSVFERADSEMYVNKKELKDRRTMDSFRGMDDMDKAITDTRKRLLDGLFGALVTTAGDGYVYLCDLKYDFSRWSLSLVDDFALKSEYMYHAGTIWQDYIHPDDIKAYNEAVDNVFCGNARLTPVVYRAKRADGEYVLLATRGFVLHDSEGNPDYFGGMIVPQ